MLKAKITVTDPPQQRTLPEKDKFGNPVSFEVIRVYFDVFAEKIKKVQTTKTIKDKDGKDQQVVEETDVKEDNKIFNNLSVEGKPEDVKDLITAKLKELEESVKNQSKHVKIGDEIVAGAEITA